MKICVNCRHVSTPNPDLAWMEYKCLCAGAVPLQTISYVTGQIQQPVAPFCQDVNTDGKCKHYEDGRRD